MVMTTVILEIIETTKGRRVRAEEEATRLDLSQHAELPPASATPNDRCALSTVFHPRPMSDAATFTAEHRSWQRELVLQYEDDSVPALAAVATEQLAAVDPVSESLLTRALSSRA